MADTDTDTVDTVDAEALERCLQLMRGDREFGRVVEQMLAEPETSWRYQPRSEVAKWCCFHHQVRNLGLRPWQFPPCRSDDPPAGELIARLRANNLSIYEPDPLRALAAAEKPKRQR